MVREEIGRQRIIAKGTGQRLSKVFEMPDLTVPGQLLSTREVEFFGNNGFLAKRGLVDRHQLRFAVQRIWLHLVAPRKNGTQQRVVPCAPSREVEGRTIKLYGLGRETYLNELLAQNPRVLNVAASLSGEELTAPMMSRGVYAVFPSAQHEGTASDLLSPHVDQTGQRLGACLYLEDVTARSGGFTVYPGSHRLIPEAHRCGTKFSPKALLTSAEVRAFDEIEPLELVAEAGAVIFWHGRLVHSPGIHTGRAIRWALFADLPPSERPLGAGLRSVFWG